MTIRPIFVVAESEPLGIGKLISRSGDTAEVEFFDSPFGPKLHTRCFNIRQIRAVELGLQTRVFWLDRATGFWRAGRVDGPPVQAQAFGDTEELYFIRFPNRNDRHIPVSDLYVRWSHSVADPAEFLAAQVSDTPFFADGRSAIVRHFLFQRAGFKGLTALASSSIELIQHQVTIVRRVLADPVQRYILADEVGLGKTIEAGVLVRQDVLDHPWDHQVLIVVPAHLLEQWRTELAKKFFLTENDQLALVSETEVASRPVPDGLSLLVVDEAHRTAAFAFDTAAPEHRIYNKLQSLARNARGVLLLSGTPVLHQESGFLAMLHLLDPGAYQLADLAAFKERVNERQTVAEALMDLGDDASVFFAEEALARLEAAFPSDDTLAEFCARVRRHLADEVGSRIRSLHLRTLREYLAETYKLHRRLLRTRRADPSISDYLPRRRGVEVIPGVDEARDEAADFLEAWRLRIADAGLNTTGIVELFATFVDASISHPLLLANQIESRLKILEAPRLPDAPPSSDIMSRQLFPGESSFLRTRWRLLVDTLASDARAVRLRDWVAAHQDVKRILLFIDDAEVANTVADQLTVVLANTGVIRYRGSAEEVRRFESASEQTVLVCDRRAEEGLNLQRVGAVIIHYDLPLEPARIEQRIGRVDRIEARGHLRNVIFAAAHPYERQWQECLCDSIRVFSRSVAPLQYALAASVSSIKTNLFRDGVDAIRSEAERLTSVLDQELNKIQAQEALDAIDAAAGHDEDAFTAMLEVDDSIADHGEETLNAWVKDRLRFAVQEEGDGIKRYVYDLRRPTLLPLSNTIAQFMACIDGAPQRVNYRFQLPLKPFSLDRSKAEKNEIPVLRVGHPFIEALEASVRNDDRGRAFAMWRFVPSDLDPALYFRMDFLIEADLTDAADLLVTLNLSSASLRRRADDAFPPLYRTIWLSSDLENVEDQTILRTLAMPYSRQPRISGGFDRNLRGERWEEALRQLDLSDWSDVVFRAKAIGQTMLRRDSEVLELCREQGRAFDTADALVASRLESRIHRLTGTARTAEELWAQREAALADVIRRGIAAPQITLDCIGAVVLAGSPLEV